MASAAVLPVDGRGGEKQEAVRGLPSSKSAMEVILHIAAGSDWRAAKPSGAYRRSTRDRSLEDEGFIHCSHVDQVARVANAIYRGVHGLVLLVIDPQRITAPVREESVALAGERFPHIYGPLNVDAVIDVVAFEPAEDGTFALPERLRADGPEAGTS